MKPYQQRIILNAVIFEKAGCRLSIPSVQINRGRLIICAGSYLTYKIQPRLDPVDSILRVDFPCKDEIKPLVLPLCAYDFRRPRQKGNEPYGTVRGMENKGCLKSPSPERLYQGRGGDYPACTPLEDEKAVYTRIPFQKLISRWVRKDTYITVRVCFLQCCDCRGPPQGIADARCADYQEALRIYSMPILFRGKKPEEPDKRLDRKDFNVLDDFPCSLYSTSLQFH